MEDQRVENVGGEAPGPAHALEAVGAVQADRAGAFLDPVFWCNDEIFGHPAKIG